jgi:hypothetical protein
MTGQMVQIEISPEAWRAIADTLPEGPRTPERGRRGGLGVWLHSATLNALTAARGPGESYSDVILRLAAYEAAA